MAQSSKAQDMAVKQLEAKISGIRGEISLMSNSIRDVNTSMQSVTALDVADLRRIMSERQQQKEKLTLEMSTKQAELSLLLKERDEMLNPCQTPPGTSGVNRPPSRASSSGRPSRSSSRLSSRPGLETDSSKLPAVALPIRNAPVVVGNPQQSRTAKTPKGSRLTNFLNKRGF